jgi:hypothetical protein
MPAQTAGIIARVKWRMARTTLIGRHTHSHAHVTQLNM